MDDDYIWGTADYRGMANVVITFVGIYAIFGIIAAICTACEWAGSRWPSATRWVGLSVGALAAIAYLAFVAIACLALLAFVVRASWDYAVQSPLRF